MSRFLFSCVSCTDLQFLKTASCHARTRITPFVSVILVMRNKDLKQSFDLHSCASFQLCCGSGCFLDHLSFLVLSFSGSFFLQIASIDGCCSAEWVHWSSCPLQVHQAYQAHLEAQEALEILVSLVRPEVLGSPVHQVLLDRKVTEGSLEGQVALAPWEQQVKHLI